MVLGRFENNLHKWILFGLDYLFELYVKSRKIGRKMVNHRQIYKTVFLYKFSYPFKFSKVFEKWY
jgi:hypothetical protein